MAVLSAIGTYLPPWGSERRRVVGPDEDAVTLGVAAAHALPPDTLRALMRVVFITRDLPLLEGGNAAALLAGIGLDAGVSVVEQLGGAPDVLDAVATAAPGTLVIAADIAPAGAAAAVIGSDGPDIGVLARISRSLPVRARDQAGRVTEYDDPRLLRERGFAAAVAGLGLTEKPSAAAGVTSRFATEICDAPAPELPTVGASSALFAIAALPERDKHTVVALDQGSATAVEITDGVGAIHVRRDEPPAQPLPDLTRTPGPDIAISLAAYERAFASKLRWEAGRCGSCATLAFPARFRCLQCGAENQHQMVPLPRTGTVYSCADVHVPVPGLPTPYTLVVVELDGVDVRALAKVTGVPAHHVSIGDRGVMVLRRVAVRSGIPDYGYALLPAGQEVVR